MNKRQQILEKVEKIFRNELSDDSLIITMESSAQNTDKWDSINNLMIITSIEEYFKISFPIDVIFNAENIKDLVDYIEENSSVQL